MNGPASPFDHDHANDCVSGSGLKRRNFKRLLADRFLEIDSAGVLLLDDDFRIAEVSGIICRWFGTGKNEWIDRPVEDWFEKAGWKPYPFDRTLLTGRTFRNRLVEWGEGEARRSLMLDGEVLEDGTCGKVAGAFVWFRDVSYQIHLEEQIRRSDRLKTLGQTAAATAHEIRNPLTAIRGFLQLLNKSVTERNMAKEQGYVAVMMSELDRVNELVSEFLRLSKPKEVEPVSIQASSILQELLPVIHNEALLHGITVRYAPKPHFPPVWVDKEQLKQVFLNLAKNAIEAMEQGGTLIIREKSVRDHPGHLGIVIRDTGPGIPPDVMERIFEPFFTTKTQGTGLGLSVCRTILHQFGGHLEAASDGGGASFTVWVPVAAS